MHSAVGSELQCEKIVMFLSQPPSWILFLIVVWAVAHIFSYVIKMIKPDSSVAITTISILEIILIIVLAALTLHSFFEQSLSHAKFEFSSSPYILLILLIVMVVVSIRLIIEANRDAR